MKGEQTASMASRQLIESSVQVLRQLDECLDEAGITSLRSVSTRTTADMALLPTHAVLLANLYS